MKKKAYLFYPGLLLSISLLLSACGGSDPATVTTGTSPVPTAPAGFMANAASMSWTKIDLSWAASTDDVGVEGYKIYNGTGGWIDNSVGTSYTVTGLVNGTEYCYTVSAYDADGNESDPTGEVCATTQLGAQLIETDDTGNAFSPQVAFDSSGNAIAVWSQYDGTWMSIYANIYNGTVWGTAELIEAGDAWHASSPQVAFDGSGNAIAVWEQRDGAHWNIYANIYNGTVWGTAELIEAGDAGSAYYPQVAFDPSGNAIAVWQQDDGGVGWNIYANMYNGTGWGTAELIELEDLGAAQYPQVAFDNSGNAIAVWWQYDGTSYNIWANTYNGTGWGAAEKIETDAGDAQYPQVAFDSSGNAIAVWAQDDGTYYNIYANIYNGTGWGTAELIELEDLGAAQYPQIAFDNSGNAIAVWHQWDGAKNNIWANIYNGTMWGTAELIEGDAGSALYPQVAFDNSGNAIAVWYQSDGAMDNIYANIYNGTGWGTAVLIEADDAGGADSPQVAVDPSGNAIAVWQQSDGAWSNIWANIFR